MAHWRARSTLVALLMAAPLTLGHGHATHTDAPRIDSAAPPQDCTQIPPERMPPIPAPAAARPAPLEVRVMSEQAHLARAREIMRVTAAAYGRIGVAMRVRHDVFRVPPMSGADAFFDWMRRQYGGRRPPGVDLVYLVTDQWAGGIADCIGGVRFPDRAFALGSVDYQVQGVVPAPTVDEGVIAAHELGHLLGAHHHYANCAEALPQGAPRGDAQPCTVMSNFALTASTTFSAMETAFILDHVRRYARG